MLSKVILNFAVAALVALAQATPTPSHRPKAPLSPHDQERRVEDAKLIPVMMYGKLYNQVEFFRPMTYDDWTMDGTGIDGSNPQIPADVWEDWDNEDYVEIDEPMCKLGKNMFIKCAGIRWNADIRGTPEPVKDDE